MDQIVKTIVKKIKNLQNGTRFTIAELLVQQGIDVKDGEKMFEYSKQIYSRISNIVKTADEYVGATVGLPYNVSLEISRH